MKVVILIAAVVLVAFGFRHREDIGRERVNEYFANYGKTTFTVHKPYSVDTFTWEGSFSVRNSSIFMRTLNKDTTNCTLHLSVDLEYPITYTIRQ